MARFLAYTSPARGHLYPVMPTLLELQHRGHDVHVRTLAAAVGAVRDVGVAAECIAPGIEDLPLEDWKATSQEEALEMGLRTFASRSPIEIDDLERAIEEVDPDLLLVDVTTVGAAALAEASGLAWAQWVPFFHHVLPFTLHAEGLAVLNGPRQAVGLEPVGQEEVWRAPLHIYFTAPPFQPSDVRSPASFRSVGPGLWEPPATLPAWLEELRDPLILVTVSSEFQRDDALVRNVLEAMEGENASVVVTTAAQDPGGFGPPPHTHVTRWLPHGPLVRRAACVVCHGGMGITQKALAAGVPVCVVPFGRDQSEVAAQVVRVGAGTSVPSDDLDPHSLRRAIDAAISMRGEAQTVAEGLASAGGAIAAADPLETLLLDRSSGDERKGEGLGIFGIRASASAGKD